MNLQGERDRRSSGRKKEDIAVRAEIFWVRVDGVKPKRPYPR